MTVTVLGLAGEELDRVEIAPKPDALRLVNAADGTPRLAAGSLALLTGAHLSWGPPPRLFCGDQALDVLDAQPGQVEFLAPPDQLETLRIRVETANGSGFVELPLSESAPALFSLGTDIPVQPGALATLYATGLGRWPEGEGTAWVSMLIGDAPVQLSAAPEAMPELGVSRLRFVVPLDVPAGPLAVRVRAGSAISGAVNLQVTTETSLELPA